MKAKVFLDSNVLVYANDASNPAKQARAREILADAFATRRACLSTQVLQEFFTVTTRKMGVPADNARAQVLTFRTLETVIVDPDLIVSAIDLHLVHRVSFWDALIVKAAAAANCRVLLTDDLAHGQVLDGLRIENPFRDLPWPLAPGAPTASPTPAHIAHSRSAETNPNTTQDRSDSRQAQQRNTPRRRN